jgi:predicted unusual protein kinase regulating ubiquinone biosynthesis (AarF/ABC1/UbiB family)
LGVLLPGANLELLTQAEAQLFDRLWGMSMQELRTVPHSEMRQFAIQFRELLYSMPFQLPHNLLLLGRTISILSGMCTGLDPDFNPWRQIAPYAQKMLTEEGVSNWQGWLDQAGELVRTLLSLPSQTARVLTRLERGELSVDMPRLSRQVYHLEGAVNRVAGGIILAALLASGAFLYSSGSAALAAAFWAMAGVALIWVLLFSRGHPPRP